MSKSEHLEMNIQNMEEELRKRLSPGGVYKKIAHVMGQIERIPKTGRNDFHGYDYVTEADLTEHIRPLMAEVGLVLIPSQSEHRLDAPVEVKDGFHNVARIWHEFTFVDTNDGSSHTFGVWGEGQDGGDKGSYKAFTGAMKYALMKAFLVATGDDPEQDRGVSQRSTATMREFSVDNKLGFGKHGDLTWRELAERFPDYIDWVAEKTDRLSDEQVAAVRALIAPDGVQGPSPDMRSRMQDDADMRQDHDLDLSGPATDEQKEQIHELYLALATVMTDAQKKRCKEALEGTEEVAAKTIEWMTDKLNSLAAAGA